MLSNAESVDIAARGCADRKVGAHLAKSAALPEAHIHMPSRLQASTKTRHPLADLSMHLCPRLPLTCLPPCRATPHRPAACCARLPAELGNSRRRGSTTLRASRSSSLSPPPRPSPSQIPSCTKSLPGQPMKCTKARAARHCPKLHHILPTPPFLPDTTVQPPKCLGACRQHLPPTPAAPTSRGQNANPMRWRATVPLLRWRLRRRTSSRRLGRLQASGIVRLAQRWRSFRPSPLSPGCLVWVKIRLVLQIHR